MTAGLKSWYYGFMDASTHETMKPIKKGRPSETGTPVQVRMQADQLARLDAWARQQEGMITRAEAIRRLVDEALSKKGGGKK